jgi:hypothetical protein
MRQIAEGKRHALSVIIRGKTGRKLIITTNGEKSAGYGTRMVAEVLGRKKL